MADPDYVNFLEDPFTTPSVDFPDIPAGEIMTAFIRPLGPMLSGSSPLSRVLPGTFEKRHLLPTGTMSRAGTTIYTAHGSFDGPGTLLLPASRTMYLVSEQFQRYSKIEAEVRFDRPRASISPVQFVDEHWAVGLNCKSGGADDFGEPRVGATCQFFNQGMINFHGTDFDDSLNPLPNTLTYDAYASRLTQFVLHISIDVSSGEVLGTASLEYPGSGNVSGNLAVDLTDPNRLTPSALTAIGVVIVNTTILPQDAPVAPFDKTFDARFNEFRLWLTR